MKKNKIKVYLQYPWKFPDSPYYKYLIDSPPKNIEYLNVNKQKGVITNKNFFLFSNFLKKQIRFWFKKLNLKISNSHESPEGNYDLIHCAHCLSKNKNKPWVADFEGFWQIFVSGEKSKKGIENVGKFLRTKNCKKIISWNKKTMGEFKNYFPDIADKFEFVYPAIPVQVHSKKSMKKINLIFSARYFYPKGGSEALEAIDRLTKKYENVYGIFNSEVPKNILKHYSFNKKIKFYSLIPQKKLFELYSSAHISIYPGFSDSFGFAYLESMSFGIPIITLEGFVRDELIDQGKTGFILKKPKNYSVSNSNNSVKESLITDLVQKSSMLIEDKNLLKNLSNNCIKLIKRGKFSIKVRNQKLNKIYKESLK